MATEVFDLLPVVANALFEGFGSGGSASFLGRDNVRRDFLPANREMWDGTLEPLAAKWKPIEVLGRVRSFNDFPCLGGNRGREPFPYGSAADSPFSNDFISARAAL